jgi:hypothetical protein
MAKFNVGSAVITEVPEVLVDAGIPAGRHRFRLVVIDSAGNTSRPDEIVLAINPLGLPIPLVSGKVGATVLPVQQTILPATQALPVVPLVPLVPVVPVRPPRSPVRQTQIPLRRPRSRKRSKP